MVASGLLMAGWLTYVSLWEHPEWTRAQLLWAYPWHLLATVMLLFVGVTLIERGSER